MISVMAILNCIGVETSGTVSLLFRLFGFFQQRVPTDPCSPTTTAQVSLLDHLNSLEGLGSSHVHLNIIRVGVDNFTDDEINRIDYAIYRTRNIYRTVNLGIGRVEHYDVVAADADGYDDIGSEAEAEELTQAWTVPNNGLDVFMVANISADFVGISALDGPCDKDDVTQMNGSIGGEVNRPAADVARTFAHEIGHYLGLPHNHGDVCPSTLSECNNLMAQTRCAVSCGSGVCQAVVLTAAQGETVRNHCFVQDGC